MRHAAGVPRPGPGAVPPADRAGALPLSFGQERLWFLDRLSPGNPFYNDTTIVRVRGSLDVQALRRSARRIVDRHEVLRTVYPSEGGAPVARVLPAPALEMRSVDLSGIPAGDREAEVQRHAREETARAFELGAEIPIRLALLHVDATEHVLLITMHHIASDAWSLDVLFRELTALYRAFSRGLDDPLPDLRVQYADFARWQRAEAETVARTQIPYWRAKLSGADGVATIPADRPRSGVRRFRGASHAVDLSRQLTAAVQALSRRERVTSFSTLLAAFYVMLHARSGRERLLVGSAVAGRGHVETDALIGFFVNTVVFGGDLSGNPTFRELLVRTSDDVIESLAHQDVPFERVVEAANPERRLDRNPLFQVWFNLVNTPPPSFDVPDLDVEVADAPTGTARIELALILWESHGRFHGRFEYDEDLFVADTIAEMATHFVAILHAALSQPDAHIRDLRRRAVRSDAPSVWKPGRSHRPSPTVVGLFRDAVRRCPDEVAVICGDRALSYEELDRRSEACANLLRSRGVGPGVVVATGLQRSVDLLAGMLAVLKAGGAYVPLDPAYPSTYLDDVVADARPHLLLTTRGLTSRFGVDEASTLCLDEDAAGALGAGVVHRQPVEPAADDLAYVIYTSGSTGRPKGVEVSHGSLLYSTSVRARVYPEKVGRFLLLSSCAFDSSVAGLYWTLMQGGTLVVPDEGAARDLTAVSELIRTHGVTHTLMVPSLYGALLEHAPDGALEGLRRVILAGESPTPQITEQHHRRLPATALVNEYGPTEATVWATMYEIDAPIAGGPVPIGRPIPDTRIHLLDRLGDPVPAGATGELYIGGPGVARGYRGQPALTAGRFVPDPFSPTPGQRLFRTGDLARCAADGTLVFLGRADRQVKIRGHRIELEEVKRHIVSHPDVLDAVVADREDDTGERRLVGYLVVRRGETLAGDRLRGFLKDRLPDYMVPAAFVTLDALPVLPNGKVDVRALPEPGPERPALDSRYAGARNTLERHLVEQWQRLLAVTPVGIHDNFFAIGGTSLKAAVLANRLTTTTGHLVTVAALFQYPSVAALSEHLVEQYPSLVGFAGVADEAAGSPTVPSRIVRHVTPNDPRAGLDDLSDDEVRARLVRLLADRTPDE